MLSHWTYQHTNLYMQWWLCHKFKGQSSVKRKCLFSQCGSHASAGTIRRLCTSKTTCQDDAKSLYENLRKLLKHFSKSPKSSELLHQALTALEINDIHLLNWGSARMTGFLDACIKASSNLVPFLDTIFKTWQDKIYTKS